VNMHKPEHWGYVQFGGSAFRPDGTWAARERLQSYYQAQFDFRKLHQRWATEAELPTKLKVSRTAAGWSACEGSLCIRQDALVK
jgi:hypothetical protein